MKVQLLSTSVPPLRMAPPVPAPPRWLPEPPSAWLLRKAQAVREAVRRGLREPLGS